MKKLLVLAGVLISLVCVYFFARAVAQHWTAIAVSSWGGAVWINICVAVVLYMATYGIIAYAWGCSLTALGHPLPYRRALDILAISQFAKYLPGNVGHHVGRVMLAKREGLPLDAVLSSILLDTAIVVAAAGLWSLWVLRLLLDVLHKQQAFTHIAWLVGLGMSLLILLVVVLAFAPRARSRQLEQLSQLVQARNTLPLGRALSAHMASVVLGGTVLFLLCEAFAPGATDTSWFTVSGVFAAAWLLGFLIPGAPAGLGVREMALLLGLGPIYGIDAATASAAALRLVTTAGDGLVFAAGLSLRGNDASQ